MNSSWIKIPFSCRFVNFKSKDVALSLPFAVGGATQQGTKHILDNHNNQDALSILIGKEFLLGTLCDGCTSTHDEIRDSFSNNEVGAKLIAHIVISNAQKLLKGTRFNDPDLFVQALSQKTCRQFVTLVKHLAGDDEKERELFIFDFLMSTIIGFVVTREHYFVFGCGDGIVCINNQITILQEAGSYFAASILPRCCPSMYTKTTDSNSLKVRYSGITSDLRNIFLATDGFNEIAERFPQTLIKFINGSISTRPNGGFDFLLPDFRKQFLGADTIAKYFITSGWPKDDASFLLIKRLDPFTPTPSDVGDQSLVKESQNDSDKSE